MKNLTINTGATLNTSGLQLSIFGNLENDGTLNLGSSPVVISGTSNQSIDGFSTTGNISMTKLGGTATLNGNVTTNQLIVNGAGGTLDLGSGHTHTVSGNLSIIAGTLTGNSSNINLTGTASQNIAGFTTTGQVTSLKTGGTATLIGDLQAASIIVNGSGGTLNMGTDHTHTISGNITITNGTFNGGSSTHNLQGNITGAGTLTGNAMNLILSGTGTQSIKGFTTTGNVQIIKTSGTATFTSDVTANQLTLNGTGSTLQLGTALMHTFNGDITLTNGTLNCGSSTLNVNAAFSGNPVLFVPSTGSVVFTGSSQTIPAFSFNSLTLNGTGTTILPTTLTLTGNYTTNQTADYTTNSNTVVLNGSTAQQIAGTSTTSLRALTINNAAGVSMSRNVTVSDALTLTSGNLNLNGQTLTAQQSIVRTSGRIIGTSGTLHMNGSSAQSIPASLFLDTVIQNLIINNSAGVTLSGWVKVTGTVTPTAGQLNTGDFLILESTASATGRIGAGTGSYITGNVQARRHIGSLPTRRWRFLSSPVQGKSLNDWKARIFITGPAGQGFDPQNTSTSVFTYDESVSGSLNDGWIPATSITNPITTGKGFRVFVRGTRSQNITASSQNEVILSLTGAVHSGDMPMPVSFTANAGAPNDGWCLVGNPYPSDFDWNAFYDANASNALVINNISPVVYIYNGQQNSYASFNAASNIATNGLTGGIIPQGAAFWVKATADDPVLVLKEAFKTNSLAGQMHKTEQGSGFHIRLVQDQWNSDEVAVVYHPSASTNYDELDVRKLPGGVNIAAYGSDNVDLSVSARPLVMQNDTIRLDVTGAAGIYNMQFINSSNIAVKDQVFLVDEFTSKYLNLKTTTSYTFNITSDPNSFGPNRFYIIVASDNSLPVDLIHFNAKATANKQVDINWATAAEVNASTFEVQRSSDNHSFETIKTVQAQGKSSELISYSSIDERPEALNYYRLKMIDNDGSYRYSAVRLVSLVELTTNNNISLYPVPAHSQLTIANKNGIALRSITLYNAMGKIVATYNTEKTEVELDVHMLQPGVYIAEITDAMGTITKQKFVKE